jgi:hypothetical protein
MANTEAENREEVDAETVANRDPESFVQNNPLVDLLTPGARVRILMTLIQLRGGKLNPSGICERAAISYDTWYQHRDDLVDLYGVVEEAGNMGNSPLYRVDMENPIVKRLEEILGLAAEQRNRATDPDPE